MEGITHLNPKELAERWGISESTLAKWRHRGTGPDYFKVGDYKRSDVRYRMTDILKYEDENTIRNEGRDTH